MRFILWFYLNHFYIYFFSSLFFLAFENFLFDFLVHCNGTAMKFPYFAEILVVVLVTTNGFVLFYETCLQQFWVVRQLVTLGFDRNTLAIKVVVCLSLSFM